MQAYYETYHESNLFLPDVGADEQAPEVAALRRPHTVAHEGTHQILQNIGVQPRLAAWPPWLVEGLAEYLRHSADHAPGPDWNRMGVVNPQHLATIRDLNEPLSGQVPGSSRPEHIGRPPDMPLVEYLITKSEFTPTDYAAHLGNDLLPGHEAVRQFVDFPKAMSRMPPLEAPHALRPIAAFRSAFGSKPGEARQGDRHVPGETEGYGTSCPTTR